MIRNMPANKKPHRILSAKRLVLFVVSVCLVMQFAVFATRRFLNHYGFTELTNINVGGAVTNANPTGVSERMPETVGVLTLKQNETSTSNASVPEKASNNIIGSTERMVFEETNGNVSRTTRSPVRESALRPLATVLLHTLNGSYPEVAAPLATDYSKAAPIATREQPAERMFSSIVGDIWELESGLRPASSVQLNTSNSISSATLGPVKTDYSSPEGHYNILLYGNFDRFSTRIEVFTKTVGERQHQLSCGRNLTIILSVGNSSDDLKGQHAVVFNMDEIAVAKDVDKLASMTSSPRQAWVYYGREPAVRLRWLFGVCRDLPLHGVWSYLSGSEVIMKYGTYVPAEPFETTTWSTDYWSSGKTKLVAWMARNCQNTFWPRARFVQDLKKHIPVDVYGICGSLACPFKPLDECRATLGKYKFYLALESAECEDYITEKMWETALAHGIVPVVYGASKAAYLREAPPNSFIYAGDFNSTRALAKFLKKLDKTPKLYAKYFEWRYKGHIRVSKKAGKPLPPGQFCSLIPFISKVQKEEVNKKKFSEFNFFSSCRTLKGQDAMYRPPLVTKYRRWRLGW